MTQPESVVLRPMGRDEHDLHLQVHAAATAAQWRGAHLDPDQVAMLVRTQSNAQITQYHEHNPAAEWLALERDGQLVGRLIVDHGVDAVRVIDLVLLDAAQGHGIGSELLTWLHRTASERGVPLRASVMAGNSGARALYERLGFQALPADNDDPGLSIALEWPPDP